MQIKSLISKPLISGDGRKYPTLYSDVIGQQPVAQLPWGHIAILMQKVKNKEATNWYINNTLKNGISRNVLIMQIEQDLYSRQGVADSKISNFEMTLPKPQSDLALQMLKNPYNFDFLTIDGKAKEREIENALVEHITRFLTELGVGFGYMGHQYKITSHGDDYWIDLLFFHVKLNAYVVIELKATDFKPEYAGKLNFYLSLVDDILKEPFHNSTIGILLCKQGNNKYKAEYALRNLSSPIGVSEYKLLEHLPKEFKTQLPSIEELENELSNIENGED